MDISNKDLLVKHITGESTIRVHISLKNFISPRGEMKYTLWKSEL